MRKTPPLAAEHEKLGRGKGKARMGKMRNETFVKGFKNKMFENLLNFFFDMI